jgi:hypothetical protein
VTELPNKPQTQKAKGIQGLSRAHGMLPAQVKFPPLDKINVLPYEMPNTLAFPLFARPCPKVPRHGFVESRLGKNQVELLQVFGEARSADPEAEVLTMPQLTGRYSGIATNVGVTWGLGHEGATAGKEPLWNVPCASGLESPIMWLLS